MNPIFKNVTFGDIRTFDDLGLILVDQNVQPAEPKINLVEVPGADGSIDLTEALGAGIKYNDRTIEWIFAIHPKCDKERKSSEVSGLLNGRRFEITIAGDEDHYFSGRVSIPNYTTERKVRTITVRAVCFPYKLHKTMKKISKSLTTTQETLNLINDRMLATPTITVEGSSVRIISGEKDITLAPGVYVKPDISLHEGVNALTVRAWTGTAKVTFEWREGAL